MTNHSLHPWRFKADGPGWSVLDADGGRVARISEIDKTDLRLMIAAPELLEALQNLLDWGREHTSPMESDSPHLLLVAAWNAIEKTKGSSHGPQ